MNLHTIREFYVFFDQTEIIRNKPTLDLYSIRHELRFKVYIGYVFNKVQRRAWHHDPNLWHALRGITEKGPERSQARNCEPNTCLNSFFPRRL